MGTEYLRSCWYHCLAGQSPTSVNSNQASTDLPRGRAEHLAYRTHRSLPALRSYFQVTLQPAMNSHSALGYSQEITGS